MKAVAVPYIVAIVLAVIIIGVAVYLIYRIVVKSPLSCEECRARFATWCATCYLSNPGTTDWIGGKGMDDELKECATSCNLYSGDGLDCTNAADDCQAVGIPI